MIDLSNTRFVGIVHAAKIKNGQIVLERDADRPETDLREGADVIVVVQDDCGPELSPAQLADVAAAAEAERAGPSKSESVRLHLFLHE